MKRKIILLLLAPVFGIGTAMAQSRITGKVVDKVGNPISGAKVEVVGTTAQTESAFDGTYSISTLQRVRKLRVSSVGRLTRTVRYRPGQSITLRNPGLMNTWNEQYRPFVSLQTAFINTEFDCIPIGGMVGVVKRWGGYAKFLYAKNPDYVSRDNARLGSVVFTTGKRKAGYLQAGAGLIYNVLPPLYLTLGASYVDHRVGFEHASGPYVKVDSYDCLHGTALEFGGMLTIGHFLVTGSAGYVFENYPYGNAGIGYMF